MALSSLLVNLCSLHHDFGCAFGLWCLVDASLSERETILRNLFHFGCLLPGSFSIALLMSYKDVSTNSAAFSPDLMLCHAHTVSLLLLLPLCFDVALQSYLLRHCCKLCYRNTEVHRQHMAIVPVLMLL